MTNLNVNHLAHELRETASGGDAGRASHTLYGGHDRALRQTLMVLQQGEEMAEHESPGEATLLILEGNVRLTAEADSWEGASGDLIPIPPMRHSLSALTDAVMLLTVVK